MKGCRDVRCHGVTDPGSAGSNRMLSFGSLPGLLLLLLFHPVWDILSSCPVFADSLSVLHY